jgi:hypothetical protein
MPLNYEHFSIRLVRVRFLMQPGFEYGYRAGELSGLYGALNGGDLFDTCQLRATLGARFNGEHWTFDISQNRIWLCCRSFVGVDDLTRQMHMLLGETRKFLGLTRKRYVPLLTERAYVCGVVPGRKGSSFAGIIKKKLLERLEDEQATLLPGMTRVGVRLIGDAPEPDEFKWRLALEPRGGANSNLRLDAELFWPLAPDYAADDIDVLDVRIATAYHFLRDKAVKFAQSILP